MCVSKKYLQTRKICDKIQNEILIFSEGFYETKIVNKLNGGGCLVIGVLSLAACGTTGSISGNVGGGTCEHEYGQYWPDENATCEHDGTKTAYCNKCGMPDTLPDVGSKLDHVFSYYTYDDNASCAQDGTKTALCDICLTATDTVTDDRHPRFEHTFTDYKSNGDATCDTNGTKTAVCDSCHKATDTLEEAGTAGHDYANGSCSVCHVSQLVYEEYSSGYSVKGIAGDCKDTEIIIPATENGKSVFSILPNAFQNNTTITKVTLPDSITLIGNNAFDGCATLASVELGEGLTATRFQAFANCAKLESVTFPAAFESLGSETFADCTNLKNVSFGEMLNSLSSNGFVGCDALESVEIAAENVNYRNVGGIICNSDLTRIVFAPKAIAGTVTIPVSIRTVAGTTFQNCTKITRFVIPKSVTKIESYAFNGCTALTELCYEGTQEEWNNLTKDLYWDSGASFTVRYDYVAE